MVRPAEDISPMTEAPLTSRTIKFSNDRGPAINRRVGLGGR